MRHSPERSLVFRWRRTPRVCLVTVGALDFAGAAPSTGQTSRDAAKGRTSQAGAAKGAFSGSRGGPGDAKAIEISLETFDRMKRDGQLTPASIALDREGLLESQSLAEALGAQLVEQLGKRKLVEKYTAVPVVDPKHGGATAAGHHLVRIPVRGGRSRPVVLLGSAFATRGLSETLAEIGRRDTSERNYAVLYEGIRQAAAQGAADPRVILEGLPTPGRLGKKDPARLLRELAKRWQKRRPTQLPRIAGKADCTAACDTKPAGCDGTKAPGGLWATAEWPLKGKSTCVKDQGPTRGTGVAFAITAAVEAAVRREHDVCLDLSEQHLHYQQKNHYFPIPPNFGDDLNAPDAVLGMMVGDYSFRGEGAWRYNPSPQRTEVVRETVRGRALHGYEKSCVGYAGTPCSETNHQGALFCKRRTRSCGYGATIPPHEAGIRVLAYNSFFDVHSPAASTQIAPVYLSLGLPVVAAFQVTQSFLDAARDGWVRPAAGGTTSGRKKRFRAADPLRGWHVALIEGYVRNENLAKGLDPAPGGGYFVVKNSWGPCVGDGGYWYVPAKYMADHAFSMAAITGIEAYGEPSVVGLQFNMALEPPAAPVLITPNDTVVHAGHSVLQWSDANPVSTSYVICLRDAVSASQGSTECTQYPVPAAEAAQKLFRVTGSVAFDDDNRGQKKYWTVAACNPAGCEWAATAGGSPMNRIVRFALPNAALLAPPPGFVTADRTPVFQWYRLAKGVDASGNWIYDDAVEKYYVTVGPSPMPAPNPPDADDAFKRYDAGGATTSMIGGHQVFTFEVPDSDPIPDALGGYVHWYVEACTTIARAVGEDQVCSRFPYWFNRPHPVHEVMYFGSLDLPGGDAPGGAGGMTFEQACDIIREVVDHPRCRNCHNAFEEVTRFDAMQPHGLTEGMPCSACHNPGSPDAPWPGEGEPVWHQPDDPGMHWKDLTPDQIIARIADPATNGGRSLAEIATHVVTDHLILWTFDPVSGQGNLGGRTPAPHAETYGQAFAVWADQWVANGASCN